MITDVRSSYFLQDNPLQQNTPFQSPSPVRFEDIEPEEPPPEDELSEEPTFFYDDNPGEAIEPDDETIDATTTAYTELQEALDSGDSGRIDEKREAYTEAIMTELAGSYRNGDGSMPGYTVLLNDPQKLHIATEQMMQNHKDEEGFDPGFGSSVNATIIIKQAEYAQRSASDDVSEVDAAMAALSRAGTALETVPDPDGRVREAVLNHPAIREHVRVVADKGREEGEGMDLWFGLENVIGQSGDGKTLEFAADKITELGRTSPDIARLLAEAMLGDPDNPADNTLLAEIADVDVTSKDTYERLGRIVTALEGSAESRPTLDKIKNAFAERLRSESPDDDDSLGIEALDFDDSALSGTFFYDLIDHFNSGSDKDPVLAGRIRDELTEAGQPAVRPVDGSTTTGTGTLQPPQDLIDASDEAYRHYVEVKNGGNPQETARALSNWHGALANEVNQTAAQYRAMNPQLAEATARDMAIRQVTETHHPDQDKTELTTATRAAVVIDAALGAGSDAKSDTDAHTQRLQALANGNETGVGGLSLYASDPAVFEQVMSDPRVQNMVDNALEAMPQAPEDAIAYLAGLANASSRAPALAAHIADKSLPELKAAIAALPGQTDNPQQVMQNLSTIASSVRHTGDGTNVVDPDAEPSAPAAPDAQRIIDEIATAFAPVLPTLVNESPQPIPTPGPSPTPSGTTTTTTPQSGTNQQIGAAVESMVGGQGTDPTLMLRIAELSDDTALQETINGSVAAGVDRFFSQSMPEAMDEASESIEALTYLNMNFGGLLDMSDPQTAERYTNYVNRYYEDNPEVGEKAERLERYSTNAAKILTATVENRDQLAATGDTDTIDNAVETFLGDERNVLALENSPGAIDYLARATEKTEIDWSETLAAAFAKNMRAAFHRFGSVATKKTAVNAARLARQGDLTQAEKLFADFKLARFGLNDKLYSQADFAEAGGKLLRINYAQEDVNAAVALLDTATDPADVKLAQQMLDEATKELDKALAEKPKIPLSWDTTTGRGLGMRGTGVGLLLVGMFAAMNSNDMSTFDKIVQIGFGTAGTTQNVALIAAMNTRGRATDPAIVEKLSSRVSALDTLGDRMIILGAVLGGMSMVKDAQNGDWVMFGIDSLATTSSIAAFWGTQSWMGGGATRLGLAMSRFGLWGTLAAAVLVGGYMGYQQYQAVQNANRFENEDTERFLREVVGIDGSEDHDLAFELRNSTKDGFGAGPMLQAAARHAGWDLSKPEDLAAYKRYLNSLSEEQMGAFVRGTHEAIDGLNLTVHPSMEDVDGYGTQSSFQSYLKRHGVPLPPTRLYAHEIPEPEPEPEPAPTVEVAPWRTGHPTRDTLWGIAGANLDTVLTDEQKREINQRYMTVDEVIQEYALEELARLNPDKAFDLARMDGVATGAGDPDYLEPGWTITVGRPELHS